MKYTLQTLIKEYKNTKGFFNATDELQNLEPENFLIFLKATNAFDVRSKSKEKLISLWNSEVFNNHFDFIINSALKEVFLLSLFSNKEFINKGIIDLLIKKHPKTFIKYAKLSKSFLKEEFLNAFSCINSNNPIIKNTFYEFNFLNTQNKKWNDKEHELINSINDIPVENILIQACSNLEIFKMANYSHYSNISALISFRSNLIISLNTILSKIDFSEQQSNYINCDHIYRYYKSQLPPKKSSQDVMNCNYSPIENISHEKKLIRNLFTFLENKQSFEYLVDNYAVNFAEFSSIENKQAELTQNNNYSLYRINLKKYTYSESLFINSGAELIKQPNHLYNINSSLAYWDYLKLPKTIIFNQSEIKIENILHVLSAFSSWLSPLKRKVFADKTSNKVQKVILQSKVPVPKKFSTKFDKEYLNIFDYKKLCYKLSNYFKWNIQNTKNIIDYLSVDLINKKANSKVNGHLNPFLKIHDRVFFLTNMLEDTKWEVFLHKRLVQEKLDHTSQSAKIESSLSSDFQNAGFKACASHKYIHLTKSGKRSGEIDVLAYKDGVLFVIEQKTTYVEENLSHSAFYYSKVVEGKAISQLKASIEYINSQFQEIKDIAELSIDRDIKDIKIIPLVVSNIFDYDGAIDNNIYKISDFTLKIILNNSLEDLMTIKVSNFLTTGDNNFDNTRISLLHNDIFNNANNPNFNANAVKSILDNINYNLWANTEYCHPEDIIFAIKENKVWDFLNNAWDFNSEVEISLPCL